MASFLNKTWVKITAVVILVIILVIVIAEAIYLNRTYDDGEMKQTVVKVEHQTGYAVVADGKAVLYFTELSDDSMFVGIDTLEAPALQTYTSTGVWINEVSFFPSCNGTVLTHDYAPDVDSVSSALTNHALDIMQVNLARYELNVKRIKAVRKELRYYLSVHNLTDGEFASVSKYSETKDEELATTSRYVELYKSVLSAKKVVVRPVSHYLITANGSDKPVRGTVLPFVSEDKKCVSGLQYKKMPAHSVLLQVGSLLKPETSLAVSLPMFTEFKYEMTDTVRVPKFGMKRKVRRIQLTDAYADRPMFDDNGRFLGFTPQQCHHVGEADTLGYKLLGKCDVDTLVKGTYTDSIGTYTGQMTFEGEPNGIGTFTYNDGGYYEGQWLHGLRHGSGFYAGVNQMVKAGEWKSDKYKGERMIYNAYRVYGIDLSRYQHEQGRKRFSIDWNNLHITYLGAKNSGDASGAINYPVSFVYIKSTQGTSIKSKYYAIDAKAARRHGILCGAYHFYSVKTKAIDQARYFLKNTGIQASDMPPVLDVEPSDKEIAKGGGEQKLFESIRTWMNTVEAQTGKRPILYVSQKFIRDHLVKAPDICEKYQVWIARYGAYRPEVKLLFWQLTPYGRVQGIHGDVDINVFNGYQEQFKEYQNMYCK